MSDNEILLWSEGRLELEMRVVTTGQSQGLGACCACAPQTASMNFGVARCNNQFKTGRGTAHHAP